MLLGIRDRLLLQGIIPNKGEIGELRLARDLRKKLRVSAEEVEAVGLQKTPKGLVWDKSKEEPPEVEFSEPEVTLILGQLEARSKAGELRSEYLPVYDYFVGLEG